MGWHSLLQGSSLPRDPTWVSCMAGKFFSVWAMREVLKRARNIGKNHNAICIWSWDEINQRSEKAKNIQTRWAYPQGKLQTFLSTKSTQVINGQHGCKSSRPTIKTGKFATLDRSLKGWVNHPVQRSAYWFKPYANDSFQLGRLIPSSPSSSWRSGSIKQENKSLDSPS